MLDDLKYIHDKDREDALGIAERQCAQLTHEFAIPDVDFGEILNVVYAGMGGSALPAQMVKAWPPLAVPFEIVRDYDLPYYIGPQTLVIVASYSGNTEEELSALAEAEAKGAKIVVMAGGGKLQQTAEAKNHPFILIPKAAQPRYAVWYMVKALLDMLGKAGLLRVENLQEQLAAASSFVAEAVKAWRPEVPAHKNPAKQLAQEMMGRSVVMYAGPKMYAAAYKWKISCNENAKQIAWVDQLPEFNHNEFLGWTQQPREKPYVIVDLRSNLEHPRVQKRFAVSARLLSGMRPAPNVVDVRGTTPLEQLLWVSIFGDFVTIYLALLNGLDPAPVELIEKFKKALAE